MRLGSASMKTELRLWRNCRYPPLWRKLRAYWDSLGTTGSSSGGTPSSVNPFKCLTAKGEEVWMDGRLRCIVWKVEGGHVYSSYSLFSRCGWPPWLIWSAVRWFEARSGAILTQMINGERRVVAFFSKAVPRHKREWGQTKLEFENLHASLKHWAVYLKGACQFKVITDCKSLCNIDIIFGKNNPPWWEGYKT